MSSSASRNRSWIRSDRGHQAAKASREVIGGRRRLRAFRAAPPFRQTVRGRPQSAPRSHGVILRLLSADRTPSTSARGSSPCARSASRAAAAREETPRSSRGPARRIRYMPDASATATETRRNLAVHETTRSGSRSADTAHRQDRRSYSSPGPPALQSQWACSGQARIAFIHWPRRPQVSSSGARSAGGHEDGDRPGVIDQPGSVSSDIEPSGVSTPAPSCGCRTPRK